MAGFGEQSRAKDDTPVARWPRGGGRVDTHWPGLPAEKPRHRLAKMLGASMLAHALLTPAPALLGLVGLLPALQVSSQEQQQEDPLNAIPIEVLGEEPGDPPEQEREQEPDPEPAEEPPPDEGAEPVAVPEPEDPEPQPQTPQPAAPEPEESSEPSEKKIGDPVAMSGAAGELADSNANVRMLLHTDVVRSHPLGDKVGSMLRRTPQWRDFFGPARVDPVEDVDRVLIAGPQLRDSSNVVAVVEHRLPEEHITAALQRLVDRRGRWIDESKRLALARADRAERVFSAPAPGIVAIAPPSALESVKKLGGSTGFPAGRPEVALQAYVVTPWRVFMNTGIQLPKSIEWARFEVRPQSGGGATVRILAQDGSEAQAKDNAVWLEKKLREGLKLLDPIGAGLSFLTGRAQSKVLERIDFSADGDQINGVLVASPKQLRQLIAQVEGFLPAESVSSDASMGSDSQTAVGKDSGTDTAVATDSAEDSEAGLGTDSAADSEADSEAGLGTDSTADSESNSGSDPDAGSETEAESAVE